MSPSTKKDAPGGLNLAAVEPDMQIQEGSMPSKFTDPCKTAAMQSMRCLERNGHDKQQCQDEFLI